MGQINVELKTSKGGQIYNQDYISQKIFDHCKVYAIADGMGQGLGGSIASEMAVQSVMEYIGQHPNRPLKEVVVDAIQFANEEIYVYTKYKPEYGGITSTITVLAIDQDYAVVSSIGDSRLYIIREGEIIFQTKDHTKASLKVSEGKLSYEQSESDPDKYILTRAIGVQHVGEIPVEELVYLKDDHFMLSTSGLHGELKSAEIKDIISNHPLSEATHLLIQTAESRGKEKYKEYDNLSVAILQSEYSSKLSPHGSFLSENKNVIKTVIGSIAATLLFFVLLVKLLNMQNDPQEDYHAVNQSPESELVEQTSLEEESDQPPLEAFTKNEEIELPEVEEEEPEVKMPEIIRPPEKEEIKEEVKKKPPPPPAKKPKPRKTVVAQNKPKKDPVIENFTIADNVLSAPQTTIVYQNTTPARTIRTNTVVTDGNYNRSASGATISRNATPSSTPIRRTTTTQAQTKRYTNTAKNTTPPKKEVMKKPAPVVLKADEVTAFVDELQQRRRVLMDLQRKLIPIMARSKVSKPKEFTKAKDRFQKAKVNIMAMESWVKDIQAPVLELSKNQITDIEKKNLFIAVERARQDISIFLSTVKK